jgi:DNA-binding Lrp family transcriptional regulator
MLTAHGRALVAIVQNPEARMRDLAEVIGVTERTAQAIVADLEGAGYVTHVRVGRRNRYSVDFTRPFRHSAQHGYMVGPFLQMLSALPAAAGQHSAATDAQESADEPTDRLASDS